MSNIFTKEDVQYFKDIELNSLENRLYCGIFQIDLSLFSGESSSLKNSEDVIKDILYLENKEENLLFGRIKNYDNCQCHWCLHDNLKGIKEILSNTNLQEDRAFQIFLFHKAWNSVRSHYLVFYKGEIATGINVVKRGQIQTNLQDASIRIQEKSCNLDLCNLYPIRSNAEKEFLINNLPF